MKTMLALFSLLILSGCASGNRKLSFKEMISGSEVDGEELVSSSRKIEFRHKGDNQRFLVARESDSSEITDVAEFKTVPTHVAINEQCRAVGADAQNLKLFVWTNDFDDSIYQAWALDRRAGKFVSDTKLECQAYNDDFEESRAKKTR